MPISRRLAIAMVLVTLGACADGRDSIAPAAPGLSTADGSADGSASAAGKVETSGAFAALVDFSTITLTPTGVTCRLDVAGRLVFTGTIVGSAVGTTSALVFAPCADVATTPPGTYRDVFRSDLEFTGTIGGQPAQAKVIYQGGVQPGGTIDAHLIFSRGVAGVLDADAVVAVGGTYSGALVVR